LAFPITNLLFTTTAVADQRVDLGIGDSKVSADRIETGKAIGIDALGAATRAFAFTPGYNIWLRTRWQ
jgi:hypothetical protein